MRPGEKFVLLIGGVSGAGKTTVAIEIGRRLGVPWLMVDDLRLAFQNSRAILPDNPQALYYFTEQREPPVWSDPPERVRDGLIAIGEVLAPALEAVVATHQLGAHPVIIEGDGILPTLMRRPAMRRRDVRTGLRLVFIIEPDEDVLWSNTLVRAHGIDGRSEAELRNEVHARWLFGEWLRAEADRRGLPVLESQPWETLADRILQTAALHG